MRTSVTTLVLILIGHVCTFAQTPDPTSFDIDTLTTIASSGLPFDVPFILKLRGSDASSIHSGIIYQWKERNGRKFFVHKRRNLFFKSNDLKELFDIDSTCVFPRKQGADIYIGPLPPNKNLGIMLAHRLDGDLLASLFEINENIRTNNAARAASLINNLVSNARNKIQSNYNFDASDLDVASFNFSTWITAGRLDPVGGYNTFYNQQLRRHYDILFDPAAANTFVHAPTIPVITTADLATIGVIAHAQEKNSLELSVLGSIIQRGQVNDVELGLIPMTAAFFKPAAESYRLDQRVNNLIASKKSLESLIEFLESLIIYSNQAAIINPVLSNVRLLSEAVDTNLTFAKGHLDAILNAVKYEPNLTYTTWAFGNNQIFDLKTKGSRYVIPVIGLATLKAFGNIRDEFLVRVYLGVSIYLRAVNKDVPFSSLNQKFLHRFSINLGLTTTKIAKGEFSDLMGSFSVLAGANYKLSQGIQLSVGTAIMQRKNINPAINDPRISFLNPYASIAFDLDLVNTIKSLTDKL